MEGSNGSWRGGTVMFELKYSDGARGITADPARIKQVVLGEIAVAPHQVEAENIPALDEEGPLFLVIGLESGQVDDRRVGLDLAEVGVDREVEGQVARDAELAVQAAEQARPAPVGEG